MSIGMASMDTGEASRYAGEKLHVWASALLRASARKRVAVPSNPHFQQSSDIKVGVVGYSAAYNMGRRHLEGAQQAGMVPTAVCEVDPDRLAVASQEFPGIQTYSSLDEMLAESGVNLVAIITPHHMHYSMARQCLEAGCHVVLEKPFAMNTEECDGIIAFAKERDLVVSTYHNRHWDGSILKARELVESGTIGQVVRVEATMCKWGPPSDTWRGSKSMSGGILLDWGVHLLEYAFQLVDGEIREVMGLMSKGYWACRSKWGEDCNEDDAVVVVRLSSDQSVTVKMSQIDSQLSKGFLVVVGTEGCIVSSHQRYEIVRQKNGERTVEEGDNPPGEGWRYYQNVADHLTRGEPLVISPEWARRPIHVIDLAFQSAREGKALPARYP